MAIASINPATGETLRTFDALSDPQIDANLQRAADTFRAYRRTAFAERARMLLRAAEILETEKETFGRLMTIEMGKPLKAAIEEAAKCAWACRYYAEHAERFLADELVETNATRSYIHYQPLGPVLAVMPWNFPFWQVFRFAAPALMAGNVALLKHASNVPQCALAIEDLLGRAGFPAGAFQTLLIGSDLVPQVLDDPRVVAATLTGSTPAGSQVASVAQRAGAAGCRCGAGGCVCAGLGHPYTRDADGGTRGPASPRRVMSYALAAHSNERTTTIVPPLTLHGQYNLWPRAQLKVAGTVQKNQG